MSRAFVEAPRDWNPIPGTNRPQKEADGAYVEVVRIYPFPAISGTFHLQLMAQWKIDKLEVVNHCPLLHVRQRLCGALSTVQFRMIVDYPDSDANPEIVDRFKAYGYDLLLLGRKDTFIEPALPKEGYGPGGAFSPPLAGISLAGK